MKILKKKKVILLKIKIKYERSKKRKVMNLLVFLVFRKTTNNEIKYLACIL